MKGAIWPPVRAALYGGHYCPERGCYRVMLKARGRAIVAESSWPEGPPYFAATDWPDTRWLEFHDRAARRARVALARVLRACRARLRAAA